jgi:uncharacterized membrane protein YoaK (UPF0700 family)
MLIQKIMTVFLFAVSVAFGAVFAKRKTPLPIRLLANVGMFCVADMIECGPYFTNDPATWATTYITGILMAGEVVPVG